MQSIAGVLIMSRMRHTWLDTIVLMNGVYCAAEM